MNTVADNQFSSARDVITIPVAAPQKGDTDTALLAKIAKAAAAGVAGSRSVTATVTDAVADGTVAAGASAVSIVNVGSANGTVAGTVTLAPGQPPITFVAPAGCILPAITYTASATAILRITRTGA